MEAPVRCGDWGIVNRHLTAGGSLEHAPWGNPYLPYIRKLIDGGRCCKVEASTTFFTVEDKTSRFVTTPPDGEYSNVKPHVRAQDVPHQ